MKHTLPLKACALVLFVVAATATIVAGGSQATLMSHPAHDQN